MIDILYRPIVTEKISHLHDKGIYAFKVAVNANKVEIARAVEKKFMVKVASVRTMILKGKTKSQMTRKGRFEGRTSRFKKAIVTLKQGDTINLFENV